MIPTVNLDDRTFDDIKNEAIRLIPRYCPEWTNHNASDPGITLIELFSWMTEMTLYRLNKVPQKNYLSMLELMGLSLIPPQSARTVIKFFPVENCAKNINVKKETKIASVSEDTAPVIFETENNLLVRDTKLISCVNRNKESFNEHINELNEVESFTLFEAENNIEHTLYICSPIFKYLIDGHTVQISFESCCEIGSVQDEIINHLYFEYWNGREWVEIESHLSVNGIKRNDNVIYLRGPVEIESCEVNGFNGLFIRATLSDVPMNNNACTLKNIKVRSIFEGAGFIPDICIKNSNSAYEAVDMNGTFRMFSEQPSFNEVFYIAADEILKNKNSRVTISYTFSEVYVPDAENDNAIFAYEYWNGKDWTKLDGKNNELIDGTFNFKQSGNVSFKIPKDIAMIAVNNEEHLFIRIRLITKDYSIGGTYVPDENGVFQWKFNSKVQSPLLNKLRISYVAPKQNPEAVFAHTSFDWIDHKLLTTDNKDKKEIKVFNIDKEHLPSLYLGFSNKIKDGDFNIYFNLDNISRIKKSKKVDLDFLSMSESRKPEENRYVNISWQYWNGKVWKNLDVNDFTDSFHESGFVNINIPDDLIKNNLFDKDCYWIRAVKESGSFEKLPVVKDIAINCVYAVNSDSYKNEIVGSGNGAPGQIFNISHPNILPGIQLVVNEGSIPSDNELEKMKKDGIEEPYTISDKQVWVKYKEVPNFYNSDAFSRHYVIDYSKGQILFGDGVHGINPPKGKFNIKIVEYKVGGGQSGNIAAHKLQFLTQSIPYISGCDNPFAAEGGSDMEDVESLKSRSSGIFKSLNRAVTREDFEWISREASSSVGRAYCLPEKTNDGKIRTILIPEMSEQMSFNTKLIPSKELLRRVKLYLDERKIVGTAITVTGPIYRNFNLKIELLFKSNVFDFDNEKNKIKEQLAIYFHALVGEKGQGFEFGKNVTKGIVLKILEKNQSILSVGNIEIFDEDAKIAVDTLSVKNDEIVFLTQVEIVDRKG